MRLRVPPCASSAAAAALACALLAAGSASLGAQAVIEYDHATGTSRLLMPKGGRVDTTFLGSRTSIRLEDPQPVRLRIVNTNTALYRFRADASVAPVRELEPVRIFLGRLGPYLPEVAFAASGGGVRRRLLGGPVAEEAELVTTGQLLPSRLPDAASEAVRKAWLAGRRLESELARLDEMLHGSQGVEQVLTLVIRTLEEMRAPGSVEPAATRLRDSLAFPPANCASPVTVTPRLAVTQGVTSVYDELVRARRDVASSRASAALDDPQWGTLRISLDTLSHRAGAALGDFDAIIGTTYRVERLAGLTANACATWDGGVLNISRFSGRSAAVTIEPRSDPELLRVSDRPPVTYTITVSPNPRLRASLGLSFIMSPDARFAAYAARPATTGAEIFQSGVRDARFGWGLTLGATWKPVDFRERLGFAFWFPELTISPSSDTRAFGLGVAFSGRFLKVGAGNMWVRHVELAGQQLGQILPTATHLKTRETYGAPRFYLSLSVIDLPPFVQGR